MSATGIEQLPLRDIHLPDAVSWWPLAPGWWLLMLLVVLVALGIFWLAHYHRNPPLRKLAQRELKHIRQQYQQHQDAQRALRDCSVFLRRVCMSLTSREQSASLTGDAWLKQLNTVSQQPLPEDIQQLLQHGPYQSTVSVNADELLQHCQQWLNKTRRVARHA